MTTDIKIKNLKKSILYREDIKSLKEPSTDETVADDGHKK